MMMITCPGHRVFAFVEIFWFRLSIVFLHSLITPSSHTNTMSAAQLAEEIKAKQVEQEKERIEREEWEEREEAKLVERMRRVEEQEAQHLEELKRWAEERRREEERQLEEKWKKAREEADVARKLQGMWQIISLKDKLTQLVENQMVVEETVVVNRGSKGKQKKNAVEEKGSEWMLVGGVGRCARWMIENVGLIWGR
jgi:hypothetical protein